MPVYGFAEGEAFAGDGVEEAGKGVGCAEDARVVVGERDMGAHRCSDFIEWGAFECGDQGRDMGEATDVSVGDSAFRGRGAACKATEEFAVAFLNIGVVMPAGLEHAGDVEIEPCFLVVIARFSDE